MEVRPPGEWVFLTYSLPRTPSAPRLSLWRKVRRLGAAQLADGLVALPADPRTREQLEWLADEVVEAGGTAGVWLARPSTRAQERAVAATMQAARSVEYDQIRAAAEGAVGSPAAERARALRRLRAELRRVQRRDFFPPPTRSTARAAVEALAATVLGGADAPTAGKVTGGGAVR